MSEVDEGSVEDETLRSSPSASELDEGSSTVLQSQVDESRLQRNNGVTRGMMCKSKRQLANIRRNRYPGRVDVSRTRLEGSRRSARECRVRRKMRYQYVADMVTSREHAIQSLRRELDMYKKYCAELDAGRIPRALVDLLVSESNA